MSGLKEEDKNEKAKNIPCLFIRGELSDYLREEDKDLVKSFFRKAEFASIFDAGHWPHADQKESFLNVVKFFLKDIEQLPASS